MTIVISSCYGLLVGAKTIPILYFIKLTIVVFVIFIVDLFRSFIGYITISCTFIGHKLVLLQLFYIRVLKVY